MSCNYYRGNKCSYKGIEPARSIQQRYCRSRDGIGCPEHPDARYMTNYEKVGRRYEAESERQSNIRKNERQNNTFMTIVAIIFILAMLDQIFGISIFF